MCPCCSKCFTYYMNKSHSAYNKPMRKAVLFHFINGKVSPEVLMICW